MIKKIRHKGLKQLYRRGVNAQHVPRLRIILARLDASKEPQDMNLPGLGLHQLSGNYAGFWAVEVSGNWRVVFRFEESEPTDVDYVDYH